MARDIKRKKLVAGTVGIGTGASIAAANKILDKRLHNNAPQTMEAATAYLHEATKNVKPGDVLLTTSEKYNGPFKFPFHSQMFLRKEGPEWIMGEIYHKPSGEHPYTETKYSDKIKYYLTQHQRSETYKPKHIESVYGIYRHPNPDIAAGAVKKMEAMKEIPNLKYNVVRSGKACMSCNDATRLAFGESPLASTGYKVKNSLTQIFKNPYVRTKLPVIGPSILAGTAAYLLTRDINKSKKQLNKETAISSGVAVGAATSSMNSTRAYVEPVVGQVMKPVQNVATKIPALKEAVKGLIKRGSKDSKKMNYAVGTAATAAASGVLLARKKNPEHFIPINQKTKRLLIVTEGGKYNTGGTGHEVVAKQIAAEYAKMHGAENVHVMNYGDFIKSKASPIRSRKLYNTFTQAEPANILHRGAAITEFTVRKAKDLAAYDTNAMTQAIHKFAPGRVIVTHPEAISVLKATGIKPEVVVTDYGVGAKKARKFWQQWGKVKGKRDVSKVFVPSQAGTKIYKNTPVQSISHIPVANIPASEEAIFMRTDPAGKVLGKFHTGYKPIVISSGSTGHGVDEITKQLLKVKRPNQIIAMTGKSKSRYEALKALETQYPNLVVTGFTPEYKNIMARAHLNVVRPHGITITEAASTGKPLIPVIEHIKKDSYAPHLIGNAEHMRAMTKTPIMQLFKDRFLMRFNTRESNRVVDEVLNRYYEAQSNAVKLQKTLKASNPARAIAVAESATISKMPSSRIVKGVLPTLAALGAIAIPTAAYFKSKDKKK